MASAAMSRATASRTAMTPATAATSAAAAMTPAAAATSASAATAAAVTCCKSQASAGRAELPFSATVRMLSAVCYRLHNGC